LFFFLFLLSFGIQPFHLTFFLRRKLRQMADEVRQLPGVCVVVHGLTPCRHARESNPILDRVVQLSIGHVLSGW